MSNGSGSVVGYVYRSDDEYRDRTVCKIVARSEPVDEGFGIEPMFRVRFSDGVELEVLAQQLTPWYPV